MLLHLLSLFCFNSFNRFDCILYLMYRKNALSDAKNVACTASGSSIALSLAQESTSLSPTNTVIAVDTIPSPHSYSWSPALYQRTHGNNKIE